MPPLVLALIAPSVEWRNWADPLHRHVTQLFDGFFDGSHKTSPHLETLDSGQEFPCSGLQMSWPDHIHFCDISIEQLPGEHQQPGAATQLYTNLRNDGSRISGAGGFLKVRYPIYRYMLCI